MWCIHCGCFSRFPCFESHGDGLIAMDSSSQALESAEELQRLIRTNGAQLTEAVERRSSIRNKIHFGLTSLHVIHNRLKLLQRLNDDQLAVLMTRSEDIERAAAAAADSNATIESLTYKMDTYRRQIENEVQQLHKELELDLSLLEPLNESINKMLSVSLHDLQLEPAVDHATIHASDSRSDVCTPTCSLLDESRLEDTNAPLVRNAESPSKQVDKPSWYNFMRRFGTSNK